MFHGSYGEQDVTLLLEPVAASKTAGTEFEAKVAAEFVPNENYETWFWMAVDGVAERLARDVATVATALHRGMKGPITLVTLVRAGTPTGVLLQRALRRLGHESVHYSISSVRGRGIDEAALDYIVERHAQESIVFVDGWTGKGFIAAELDQSIARYNASRGTALVPSLVVLADLAGVAETAASGDDYLIPFSMLLGTICGLIGGSFANDQAGQFDRVLYFDTLADRDISAQFIRRMEVLVNRALRAVPQQLNWSARQRETLRRISEGFVAECINRYGLDGSNSVKPGICEAYRALLTRKVPMQLLVRDPQADALELRSLYILAEGKDVEVVRVADMPYRAAILLNPRR
jgi:hypothetical protein